MPGPPYWLLWQGIPRASISTESFQEAVGWCFWGRKSLGGGYIIPQIPRLGRLSLSQLAETVVQVQPDGDTGCDGKEQDLKPRIQEDSSHTTGIALWQMHPHTQTSFNWLSSSTHQ